MQLLACLTRGLRIKDGIMFFLFFVLGISTGSSYAFDPEEDRKLGEDHATSNAIIKYGMVAAPLLTVTLLRKGSNVCAVRFTSYSRDNDMESGNVFHSGEESFHAEYDEYSLIREGLIQNKYIGHRKLDRGESIGIGRFIFPTLRTAAVSCGEIKNIHWFYPVYIRLYVGKDKNDRVSIAPTGWTKFEDVDLSNQDIIWYEYGDTKFVKVIPVIDLPR